MKQEKNIASGDTGNGEVAADMQVTLIDINSIVRGYGLRKSLGDTKDLEGSIEANGIQNPLIVREVENNQHEVIDGWRRLEIIRKHGRQKVPCIVKNVTAAEAAHLIYEINKKRSGFTPIEEAEHFKAMQEKYGYSTRDLGRMGYGSASRISNIMRLLDLPEAVQNKVQDGELPVTHAGELLKLKTSEEQENMAKEIVKDDLSVKQVERKIDKFVAKGQKVDKPPEAQPADTDISDVYIKQGRDMSELTDESVHLIVATLSSDDEDVEKDKVTVEECARVIVPGGVMALQIHENAGRKDSSKLDLRGPKYQGYLRKFNVSLSDLIILKFLKEPPTTIDWYARHTSYGILPNYTMVYVFRKGGEREIPAKDVVQKSTLTEEERLSWLIGIWDVGQSRIVTDEDDLHTDEVCRRLIRLYSYEGETVLDPWLRSGTTVKVARELNRKGIGYERDAQYKPIIMKKLGLESKKPTPEFFTNMTPEQVEKVQADSSVPEDERQELPESHQAWVPPPSTDWQSAAQSNET